MKDPRYFRDKITVKKVTQFIIPDKKEFSGKIQLYR